MEDSAPVTTEEEARQRVSELVGHAIRPQLWFMLLDAHGRQLSLVIPVDGIPLRPEPGSGTGMASALNALVEEHVPGGSVILTLERPGTAALTASDEVWAEELWATFGKVLRITGMFVAHDDGICGLSAPRPALAQLGTSSLVKKA